MKTIILGYTDERGESNPRLVCGPEVDAAKQHVVFTDAKLHHDFPQGVKRLDQCTFEAISTAIFIDSNTATSSKERREAEVKAEATKKANKDASIKFALELAALENAVKQTAKSRNLLLGKRNEIQVKIRNSTLGGSNAKALESLNGDLKALEKPIEEAIAAYEKAAAALEAVKSPSAIDQTTNTISI